MYHARLLCPFFICLRYLFALQFFYFQTSTCYKIEITCFKNNQPFQNSQNDHSRLYFESNLVISMLVDLLSPVEVRNIIWSFMSSTKLSSAFLRRVIYLCCQVSPICILEYLPILHYYMCSLWIIVWTF